MNLQDRVQWRDVVKIAVNHQHRVQRWNFIKMAVNLQVPHKAKATNLLSVCE
jgi:hypothetical protein